MEKKYLVIRCYYAKNDNLEFPGENFQLSTQAFM